MKYFHVRGSVETVLLRRSEDDGANDKELCSDWLDSRKWRKYFNDAIRIKIIINQCRHSEGVSSEYPKSLKMIALNALHNKIANAIDSLIYNFAKYKCNRVINYIVPGIFEGIYRRTEISFSTLYSHWFAYYRTRRQRINSLFVDNVKKFYDTISQYILTERRIDNIREGLQYGENTTYNFQFQNVDFTHYLMRSSDDLQQRYITIELWSYILTIQFLYQPYMWNQLISEVKLELPNTWMPILGLPTEKSHILSEHINKLQVTTMKIDSLRKALVHEMLIEKITKSNRNMRNVKLSNAAFKSLRRPRTKKWRHYRLS